MVAIVLFASLFALAENVLGNNISLSSPSAVGEQGACACGLWNRTSCAAAAQATVHSSCQSECCSEWWAEEAPLATVVVLTCHRPQYVLLALRQIAAQHYRPLEALVVDDGTAQLSPLLRAAYPALEIVPAAVQRPAVASPAATGANATDAGDGLSVRLLSLPRHASIGEKRALASRAARGAVILHWDDDDFHEPSRVSAQVAPIARGAADVTALELSHMVAMPSMAIYATPPGRRIPLFSSLAYRASLGTTRVAPSRSVTLLRPIIAEIVISGGDGHAARRNC